MPWPNVDRSHPTPSQMILESSLGHTLTAAESPPQGLCGVILYMTSQLRISPRVWKDNKGCLNMLGQVEEDTKFVIVILAMPLSVCCASLITMLNLPPMPA